jgi:acetoacetyl-CoA synthetase
MPEIQEGDLLWEPSPAVKENANMTHYMQWLRENNGLDFQEYRPLWQWSVENIADFWKSLWDYFQVTASQQPTAILSDKTMPGTKWFAGARLNYAENFFARMTSSHPAILYKAEDQPLREISWQELYEQTNALAQALRVMGVRQGDRVVAYMPNIPEAIIGLLACASLGAVWSSSSPDFGSRSVLDRFQQIEPKVLLAVDGYTYNGRAFDRRQVVAELQAGLPTLEMTVLVPLLAGDHNAGLPADTLLWEDLLAAADPTTELTFAQLPFDHPLWVLYSSGTTGRPKPIVHGHGGILLEHLKETILHLDLKPQDRFFWYTSTGWMMWNFLVGGLLSGCSIVLYNGGPGYPSLMSLWDLAAEVGITYFGTSAAFVGACMKEEIRPGETHDLSRVQAVGSTGSPLTTAGFQWVYENVNQYLALESVSGGTDLCTAFVGGCRLLPIYAGRRQCDPR